MTERQNFLLSLYREFGNNAQNALDFVKKNDNDNSVAPATSTEVPELTAFADYKFLDKEVLLKEFHELSCRFMVLNNYLMNENATESIEEETKETLDSLADGIYHYIWNVKKGLGDINCIPLKESEFEAIDLSLPSGTKWSNMNLGAKVPTESGYYLTHEEACDVNLGENWKLPETDDFVELDDNCNHEWCQIDGVWGMKFISKINGNFVFFPAAGYYDGTTLLNRGTSGNYWASTLLSSTSGRVSNFSSSGVYPQYDSNRFYGFSVRAVQKFA